MWEIKNDGTIYIMVVYMIMRCALTIAGSDSIGGAGIQTDIKAMASLGVHAHTVITAVTAQNTTSVASIMPIPCEMIYAQLDAVLSDSDVRSIKTGMLYSPEIASTVVERLCNVAVPIVVDPVMIASVGDSLAGDGLVRSIKKDLMPICDLITPNKYEAEAISGMKIRDEDDAMRACELMGKEGNSVYLKGGHMESSSVVDILYHGAEFKRFEYPRLERAGHGSGCTLSAYITANLAKDIDMINSILIARDMIQRSIASMYAVGKGDKIVNSAVNMKQIYTDGDITKGMAAAIDDILRIIPGSWVPAIGMNIAYAAAGAKNTDDVAAVSGKITLSNGRPARNGDVRFGAAEHISYMILSAMRFDDSIRAAMNIRYDEDLLSVAEEVGIIITSVDRERYPDARLGELTTFAIKNLGAMPDMIYDMGTHKREPMIRLLGKDLADLKRKIGLIV
ncbi:MAG: bifunctional hydroxymethylpyrimidine kinase/phosphomethylpyrimidine kinase [Methanomassiliicoccaceae archaeon]|jgi:hydroxymethylpyrimidine/phosphomethylpyrimidine kinase|nr:bifunctional hydroxymethylpyrimidine kinase/phosphomethylpyrimidine kinase [Methanomassiliicoccaceae archaeon]